MMEEFFDNQMYYIQRAALDDALCFGDITKENYLAESKKLDAKYKNKEDNGKTI